MLDGEAITTCLYPIQAVQNQAITTIEGLSEKNDHPVQKPNENQQQEITSGKVQPGVVGIAGRRTQEDFEGPSRWFGATSFAYKEQGNPKRRS